MGAGFNRLWAASIGSNLADGLGRTAVPLIATTLTDDPLLIAGIASLVFVPWLLFGVLAGVIVDRVDRRIAMAVANGVRVLAASSIALLIATDTITIWWLYAAIIVWGVGETIYDNATVAMVPSIVGKAGLERANSRMQASDQLVQNFIATPIAGVLFAAAVVLPVIVTGAGFFVAAALALTLPLSAGRAGVDAAAPAKAPSTARADFREAFTYLWGNHLLRTFVLFSCIVGSLLAFAQSTMVLLFLDTLEVPVVLIGFVTAAIGVGGLVGALTASALVARFGRGKVMLGATLVGTGALVLTGLAPNVWVACVAYAVSAAGISTWNVPWGALRQDIVPGRLLGRVTGLNRSIVWGSFVVAGLIGGLVSRIDLRLPFIIGGALAVLATLVAARMLLRVDASTAEHHARVASADGAVADAASDAVGRLR
jgi:MFS family permease